MPRLPDPEYDHLASRVHRLLNQFHGADERFPQSVPQPLQLQYFDIEDTNRLFKVIHLPVYCGVPVGRARICMTRSKGIFMKTILSVCIMLALATAAWAQPPQKGFSTTNKRGVQNTAPPPPISRRGEVQGAVPTGVRGGNPLQMLNPKAPARYGTWVQNTSFDPNVPGKWKGIKLFEIVF